MHRLLVLILLVTLSLSKGIDAFGQRISIQLPEGLVNEYRMKSYVDSAIAANKSGIVTPVDPVSPVPPPLTLKPCDRGPEIQSIFDITPTGLAVNFDGQNVFGIDFKVYNASGQLVSSGAIKPTSSKLSIPYTSQASGNYKLVLDGNTCTGHSEKTFEIRKNVSEVSHPEPVEGQDVTPAKIASGMPWHMDVSITGSSKNWKLSDNGQSKPDEGYEFRYIINNDLFTSAKAFKDYTYQSDSPIRVLKFMTKPGLDNMNRWSDNENNYYYSTTAGKVFSYNVTAPFQTFVFKNANTDFFNPLPANYAPEKRIVQWAEITSFKLPKGHVFIEGRGEFGRKQVYAAGQTHLSHFDLPWTTNQDSVFLLKKQGLTYFDVQRLENFLQLKKANIPDDYSKGYNKAWWPNGPLDEATSIQKANNLSGLDAVFIAETLENDSWIQQHWPMWGWFYKRLKARYETEFGSRGIPYYICHNYFQLGMPSIDNGRESAKDIVRNPGKNNTLKDFLPGGSLVDNNLIMTAVYLGAPDNNLRSLYGDIYNMITVKAIGKEAGIFLAGVHEWRPNNYVEIPYPAGKFYKNTKIPLDPNVIIGYGFLAQVYGKVFVDWGDQSKTTSTLIDYNPPWSQGEWFPTGTTSPSGNFPYYSTAGSYNYGYTGAVDFAAFGSKMFAETFGKVEGGQSRYLRFRVDGGSWITPEQAYADEIVNAYYDKRGFVFSRTLEGKTAWFYLNSFADNLAHKLEVELPDGKITAKTVASNAIHATIQ